MCIRDSHSTALGPALGGTRMFNYPNEEAAVEDVLRLARGMTYKAAAADLDLGGGKAVIIGDPARDKNEQLLRAYGRCVEKLGGRYITSVSYTHLDVYKRQREPRSRRGSERLIGPG